MTPKKYLDSDDSVASFWCSIAAILLVSALENLPILQIPFNTAFARYMGDISFSLYVFHVPLYLTVGRWITVHLIKSTGSHNLGFVIGGGLLTAVLIVVADIQWRAVDMNSVKFARWLEEKVFP
jgi:peptidoglycan/LPS O-acetylase OafA/YrhL